MTDLRCDDALQALLRQRLAAWPLRAIDVDGRPHAAVAVAVTDAAHGAELPGMAVHDAWSDHPALVLTRRAGALRKHAGQWALPGGRIDAGETPEQAALRELAEEVHLQLPPSAVLGRLDDFSTRSGFVITPVVVWAGPARELRPNPDEVQSIHRIPLGEFMRADAPLLDVVDSSEHPVLRMPVGQQWIAAPTGAIVYQFCEVAICGRATRVAHFEQPRFAWK
jgi:8-oxo-dGTP pyrophosphatase MutT (NUDIX family)